MEQTQILFLAQLELFIVVATWCPSMKYYVVATITKPKTIWYLKKYFNKNTKKKVLLLEKKKLCGMINNLSSDENGTILYPVQHSLATYISINWAGARSKRLLIK